MKHLIYLDHAATTPVAPEVLAVMQPYWQEQFYNPSSLYEPARKVKQALQKARQTVAQVLGAKSIEIIFTAGATESINLGIGGVLKKFPGKTAVISALEHEAVTAGAAAYGEVKKVNPPPNGIIDPAAVTAAVSDKTVLVSIGYVNNEIGAIQPIAQIARELDTLKKRRRESGNELPLYFHTDATQAANYLDLHVSRLGVDLMTLNGSKIYGPKQSAVLYVKSGVELEPVIYGGGQERGLRSGTESVATAVGFAAALELAAERREPESRRLKPLQQALIADLSAVLGATLNGDGKKRAPNNVNISFAGINGETLVHYLDRAGILVSTGSACSATDYKPSPVLTALGLTREAVNGSLRVTLGRATTAWDIEAASTAIRTAVERLRSL